MIYAYAKLTVTDPAKLDSYRHQAGEALAKHGGKVEQASADLTALDGAPDMPDVGAILSFPDKAAAMAWIDDQALSDIHGLRRGAGKSDIVLLG